MHTTPYIAENIARAYTRDRIRDAEAGRAARAARATARERRDAEPTAAPAARIQRWRIFSARTSAA